jgi:hypothetical protein
VVGFAARAKKTATLQTIARLCRWIEKAHGVPQVWPNGFVRWSRSSADPGGHNRDAMNWDRKGGHYGHSQVPENSHWDPGYTPAETLVVTPDAGKADALLAQVHLLTGSPASPPRASATSANLQSTVQQVVEGIQAALAAPNTSSFPDGVHTIEVRLQTAQNVCMCAYPVRLPGALLQFAAELPQNRDAGGGDSS